ncbi:carbon catabolite repressor protein 4 homolog 3-like isoform X1 [Dioscorea cayenensis subsp. rotundata]|uniref:Carbon catabolite repressor protein 4 homolog 3-like isoform X1 n=1 Tax=Dioscorea cayennensis subsp. rotundata TaxID=55577 RepID=A0AB40D003_DIOCR|nr:carbon catabolite repressor protein 4 homolog 3-like isoform X1 [Dioscorea cayenensis subsp. rotundata]
MLLEKAYDLSEKWGNIPILVMGDFNCTPEDWIIALTTNQVVARCTLDSGIYKFLSTSKLNIAEHDRSGLSGQEKNQSAPFGLLKLLNFGWTDKELRNATGSSNCTILKHPLKLRSSYATVKGTNPRTRGSYGEPLATTYHAKFLGTVDYIWYSSGVTLTKVLDTLPSDALLRIGSLPCKDLGSDHLPLVAEFAFTESGRSKADDLRLPVKKYDNEEE